MNDEKKELSTVEIMIRDYQALFSSGLGRRVLTDILTKNFFFSRIQTDEQRIRRNVALEILQCSGFVSTGSLKPITDALVNAGLNNPVTFKEGE